MSTARDLLKELERHQVIVERRGDRLRLRAPRQPPSDLLERLRRCKPEILPLLPDANERPIVRWRLPDHPPNTWVTAIGPAGTDRNKVAREILARWPGAHIQCGG